MKRALLFLAVMSCAERPLEAVDPVWGKQQCAHCAMLVSAKPPAAQAITADGKRKHFDDLGCMVAWEDRESPKVAARWVRSPEGAGWLDPAAAHFVGGQATPMDSGFLPDPAGPFSFSDVRAAVRERARRPR